MLEAAEASIPKQCAS